SRGGMRESLSPEQCLEFFSLMGSARRETNLWGLRDSMVSMNRALQFLHGKGEPYICRAGDSLLAVMPNGDLLPCRRMPIVVGNLFRSNLVELYYKSNLLHLLREKGRVARGCEQCDFRLTCRGGLRCLSFAQQGDPFLADPGCWLAVDKSQAAKIRLSSGTRYFIRAS
ncbi:MAG: SPASM domain-containing protein, partial [Desulfobulbaceae bacterium]|nr:SPASM domain-containing protein [Desulfobulbaceae bacterium]